MISSRSFSCGNYVIIIIQVSLSLTCNLAFSHHFVWNQSLSDITWLWWYTLIMVGFGSHSISVCVLYLSPIPKICKHFYPNTQNPNKPNAFDLRHCVYGWLNLSQPRRGHSTGLSLRSILLTHLWVTVSILSYGFNFFLSPSIIPVGLHKLGISLLLQTVWSWLHLL